MQFPKSWEIPFFLSVFFAEWSTGIVLARWRREAHSRQGFLLKQVELNPKVMGQYSFFSTSLLILPYSLSFVLHNMDTYGAAGLVSLLSLSLPPPFYRLTARGCFFSLHCRLRVLSSSLAWTTRHVCGWAGKSDLKNQTD